MESKAITNKQVTGVNQHFTHVPQTQKIDCDNSTRLEPPGNSKQRQDYRNVENTGRWRIARKRMMLERNVRNGATL